MMGAAHIKQVASAALASFDSCMGWLALTGGKNQGREYLPLNPKRADNRPGSFSINRDSGAWMDGATGDQGGDLVSLAAYIWDMKQGEAAKLLGDRLGITPDDSQPAAAAKAKRADDGLTCVMPVPDKAPPPLAAHPSHGNPSKRWAYCSADGAVCFYHCRFEPRREGERKQFAPLTLWREKSGRMVWKWKAPPDPRPIYGQEELAGWPKLPVCIVEGEKAADAAAKLLPDCLIVTWAGGSNAVTKFDWSPLAKREVWLWPDADDPGKKAMRTLAKLAKDAGASRVRGFNLAAFAKRAKMSGDAAKLIDGPELKQGEDAADLQARGWTEAHMALLLDSGALFANPKAKATQAGNNATARHFTVDDGGVCLIDVHNGQQMPPRFVCDRVAVLAKVRNPGNREWGLLVAFDDPDKQPHRVVIPMELFKGDGLEVAAILLDHGLTIAHKARPLLIEYLQSRPANKRARITRRTGWHGEVYVMPDRAFGNNDEEWIFESDSPTPSTYAERGTLNEWRKHVAALCRGNSRLLFSVSVAFASPLLHLAGAESGGFHFRSNSSDGKTTALRVAASVCGGHDFMQRWRATDNGLEGLAMLHCDAPLLLDELAQLDPRAAGEVAYMLANGGGKIRSQRLGGLRGYLHWRLLFLSAGEIGLAQHMGAAGKSPKAGQELRLAEIPADAGKGLGVFEQLHGMENGSEFAKALGHAARQHYGTAWLAYLEGLVAQQGEIADAIAARVKEFERDNLTDQASGQARRVAARFALVGAAGELATKMGITGWAFGEAWQAAEVCFLAWLGARGGEGNQEEQAMIAQVREFIERHGEGRFTDMSRSISDDNHAPRVLNRAGFRCADDNGLNDEFLILPEIFRREICAGFDYRAVARLLIEKGMASSDAGRLDTKKKLPGLGRVRVYHVLPSIFDTGA